MQLVENRLLGSSLVVELREVGVTTLVDIIQSGLDDQRPLARTSGGKAELKAGLKAGLFA